MIRFSATVILPIMPSRCRSSGILPTPALMTSLGLKLLEIWRPKDNSPSSSFLRPEITSASIDCPFPDTPAIPRISCSKTVSETFTRPLRTDVPFALTLDMLSRALPTAILSRFLTEVSSPTINFAIIFSFASLVKSSPTFFPSLRTTILSENLSTSFNL